MDKDNHFRDVKTCMQCKWFSFTDDSQKRFKWHNPTSLCHICVQDFRDHDNCLVWSDTSDTSRLMRSCKEYDLMPFEVRPLPSKCPYKTEHFIYDCNISGFQKTMKNIALVVKTVMLVLVSWAL